MPHLFHFVFVHNNIIYFISFLKTTLFRFADYIFEPQNHTLLKNIRSLFKQEHVVNKPKRVVCELIGIIDHIEFPEAVHIHLDINHPLFNDIFDLIDQAKYKKVFDKMPQDIFNTSVRNKLQFAFNEDKDINWEYLKELILSRNNLNSG